MRRYILAFLVLLCATLFLYRDFVFNGKRFNASDIRQWRNSAQVALEYKKQHPEVEDVLWNPNMFGGMPNYAITYGGKVSFIDEWISIPFQFLRGQAYHTLLFSISLFIIVFIFTKRIDVSLSIAVVSIFLPNFVSLFEAGHNSKAHTSALFVALLFSFVKTIESRKWVWGLLFSIFVAFSFRAAHPQVIYYGLLSLAGFGIYYWIAFKDSVIEKIKVSSYLLSGIILALGLYALQFLPVREYMHETIRGGGGLNTSAGASGLSHNYANSWSFHPLELLTFLNPSYFGLFSGKYEVSGLYWGWMPFTSASFYMGVILIPFSILGIMKNYKKQLSIALLITMGVALIIAFGKYNFIPFLNEVMLDYIPYYNKFRAPNISMTFVQVIFFVFAGLGLKAFINERKEISKIFYIIIVSLVSFLLISVLTVDMFSFTKDGEIQQYGKNLSGLIKLRHELFVTSNMISILFLLALFASTYAYFNSKIKIAHFLIIITLASTIDLYRLDKRYLKKLVPKKSWNEQFGKKSETDKFLQKDKSQFRILPMTSLFSDTKWSYYHENLGGYSGAKLSRLQTLIEKAQLNGLPNMSLTSMMNVKYFLFQVKNQTEMNQIINQFKQINLDYRHLDKRTGILVFENPFVLDRLFLPDSIISLSDQEEILRKVTNQQYSAKRFSYVLNYTANTVQADTFSYRKTFYDVHRQEYEFEINSDGFIGVSEMYYPHGWDAYVDGEPIEIFQTNFFIRGVRLPKGKHRLEFRFEPKTYAIASVIAQTSSYIYYGLFLFTLFFYRKQMVNSVKSITF